jgi:hypothetical protein
MELGESRFGGLQIVGHNIHTLLFVLGLETSTAFLKFEQTGPVSKASLEIIGADISNG